MFSECLENSNECLENSKYYCDLCQFKSHDKTKYSYHLTSKKHKTNTGYDNDISSDDIKVYNCICGFKTNHAQSLSRHKKKCSSLNDNLSKSSKEIDDNKEVINQPTINELYDLILNQNKEIEKLKQLFQEQQLQIQEQQIQIQEQKQQIQKQKQQIEEQQIQIKQQKQQIEEQYVLETLQNSKINKEQNIEINYNHNQTKNVFNLDKYLYEECKDALNLNDWIEKNYIPTEKDFKEYLKNSYRVGLGLSIIKFLNQTKQTLRPIQTTDERRNHFMFKYNNKWLNSEVKEDMIIFHKMIKKFESLHLKYINNWKFEMTKIYRQSPELNKRAIDEMDIITIKGYSCLDDEDKGVQNLITQIIKKCEIQK